MKKAEDPKRVRALYDVLWQVREALTKGTNMDGSLELSAKKADPLRAAVRHFDRVDQELADEAQRSPPAISPREEPLGEREALVRDGLAYVESLRKHGADSDLIAAAQTAVRGMLWEYDVRRAAPSGNGSAP